MSADLSPDEEAAMGAAWREYLLQFPKASKPLPASNDWRSAWLAACRYDRDEIERLEARLARTQEWLEKFQGAAADLGLCEAKANQRSKKAEAALAEKNAEIERVRTYCLSRQDESEDICAIWPSEVLAALDGDRVRDAEPEGR